MSAETGICWLYFLAHFLADKDKIWFALEAVQAEHPDPDTTFLCSQGK